MAKKKAADKASELMAHLSTLLEGAEYWEVDARRPVEELQPGEPGWNPAEPDIRQVRPGDETTIVIRVRHKREPVPA